MNPLLTLAMFTVGCVLIGFGVHSWLVGLGIWLSGLAIEAQVKNDCDS